MAQISFGVNDALTVKRWSKALFEEALKDTMVYRYIGKNNDNVFQMKDDLSKGAGDKVTYGLRMQLLQDPHVGDSTLRGEEEKLVFYSDSLLIDLVRHGISINNRDMTDQRVLFDVRTEGKNGLHDYFVGLWDYWMFNQLCCFTPGSSPNGNNPGVLLGWTGQNTPPTVDASHYLANPAGANDQAIVAAGSNNANMISLTTIDSCILKAKTLTPMIRPISVSGKKKYVLFIHPQQSEDIRTNTNTGQWLDIQKAAMTGGDVSNNPIYTDAMGEYHNTVICEDVRVTNGVSSATTSLAVTTVRRAVFCGAQAGVLAYGREPGAKGDPKSPPIFWREQADDYQQSLGISANFIGGMKAATFNSALFGLIIAPVYSAS